MAINDNTNCYGYMRLTHLLTVCWGYPITRRQIHDNSKYDVDSIVEGMDPIQIVQIFSHYIYIYIIQSRITIII